MNHILKLTSIRSPDRILYLPKHMFSSVDFVPTSRLFFIFLPKLNTLYINNEQPLMIICLSYVEISLAIKCRIR